MLGKFWTNINNICKILHSMLGVCCDIRLSVVLVTSQGDVVKVSKDKDVF